MWTSKSSNDNLITAMFRTALALEEPWELTHIEYDDKDEAWHLFVDFPKGTKFACHGCGTSSNYHVSTSKMVTTQA